LHMDFRLRDSATNRTLTDDLQVHLLQLKHLQVSAEAVYNATPEEKWAWFLRNVHELTLEDVVRIFPDEVLQEAFGVLLMISQTAEEMIAYEARLKHQRDEEGRMLQARLDGEAAGEARGRITLLQGLLGQRVWTAEEIAVCDTAQLTTMAEQLEQQLKSRMT
jgi:hypothetical protein